MKGDHGEVVIEAPRDRNGTFEPMLVKKRQRRITGMDEQILCLYAKGLSTRDIVEAFREPEGATGQKFLRGSFHRLRTRFWRRLKNGRNDLLSPYIR